MPQDTQRTLVNRLGWLKPSVTRSKLLLACKAALAVGIAWVVAPLMPGVVDEYPYYAPLGALLSMHSTLKGSAKYGLQILAGLALGILLAAIVLVVGAPNFLTISLVVAVATEETGTFEKLALIPATAVLVWLASRVRRIGSPPLHHS